MKIIETALQDVHLLEPRVFTDHRGFFFESHNERHFQQLIGRPVRFVQDNHSQSGRGVLRGLHYQIRQAQGKLVRALSGEIFDVVVDLRRSSPTFGHWASFHLSSGNRRILWVPDGFAHGFLTLSEVAEVQYKTTDYWAAPEERCIIWNDPTLNISWPLEASGTHDPLLAAKDAAGARLLDAEVYP